jgi:preprotein translocase subunit SecG
MGLLINILLGLYLFVAVLMILVILMQRPKSEGLGAAFGGGVTENIFGAQTTNVLTKITSWLAAIFFILTFVLSILYAQKGNTQSGLGRDLRKDLPPAPVVSPTPGASPTAAAATSPTPNPGPSSAVGPPGTITNLTPATTGPGPSVKPADLAVGAVPPASASVAPFSPPTSSISPAGSASPAATPTAPTQRRRR